MSSSDKTIEPVYVRSAHPSGGDYQDRVVKRHPPPTQSIEGAESHAALRPPAAPPPGRRGTSPVARGTIYPIPASRWYCLHYR